MSIIVCDFNDLERFDLPRPPGGQFAMAQYQPLFPRYLSIYLRNLVLVSYN